MKPTIEPFNCGPKRSLVYPLIKNSSFETRIVGFVSTSVRHKCDKHVWSGRRGERKTMFDVYGML